MKRKSSNAPGIQSQKIIKTSISLPENLMDFAEERCAAEGFNSFSGYVVHLLRMAKRESEAGPSGKYPDAKPAGMIMGPGGEPALNEGVSQTSLKGNSRKLIETVKQARKARPDSPPHKSEP